MYSPKLSLWAVCCILNWTFASTSSIQFLASVYILVSLLPPSEELWALPSILMLWGTYLFTPYCIHVMMPDDKQHSTPTPCSIVSTTRVSQVKTVFFFKFHLLNECGTQLYNFPTLSQFCSIQALQCLKGIWIPMDKIFLWLSAQPTAVPLHHNGTSFLLSPLWVSQTYGNHLGLGLVSIADVEDTQSAILGLLQLFALAVWGRLLSRCKRIPLAESPCRFDLTADRRFFERSECEALVILFPERCVVLQEYASLIQEESA
jgi:hypothetical protein